jgi:hypothetical protein
MRHTQIHARWNDVRVAKKAGGDRRNRTPEAGFRGGGLKKNAFRHESQFVSNLQSFDGIVGDKQNACARLAQASHNDVANLGLHGAVEAGKGLVQKNNAWTRSQGPRNGDALLFASGKHVRPGVCAISQSNAPKHLEGSLNPLRLLQMIKAECDVIENAHVREKSAVLEDEPDPPALRSDEDFRIGDRVTLKKNLASLDRFKSCEHAQQRTLTASRRPEQAGDFTVSQNQRDIAHCHRIAKASRNMTNLDQRRRHRSFA